MPKVASQEHLLAARKVKQWVSKYVANRDMVSMGAYMPGSDPDLDAALKSWAGIQAFLRQEPHQQASMADSQMALLQLVRGVR